MYMQVAVPGKTRRHFIENIEKHIQTLVIHSIIVKIKKQRHVVLIRTPFTFVSSMLFSSLQIKLES